MWLLILTIIVSAVLTGVFRQFALKYSLVDHPNCRSSHDVPTPRGGGVAIVGTFFAGSILQWWNGFIPDNIITGIVICAGLVALVGFLDDHWHLSVGIRFCTHVVCAIGFLFFLNDFPLLPWFDREINFGVTGYVAVTISLVWLLNLYNFMDGIDGIAGVEAICVAGAGAFIIWLNKGDSNYVFLLLLLVASTAGFLFWNWPPAKIFMGDTCSGFLGFVLGLMAIITSADGGISIWSWLILLGFFLSDATITLIRRIFRGEKFYEAHRSHAYQILSRRLNSHLKVTFVCLLINVFWLFPLAYMASYRYEWGVLFALVAFFPLVVFVIKVGAGALNN